MGEEKARKWKSSGGDGKGKWQRDTGSSMANRNGMDMAGGRKYIKIRERMMGSEEKGMYIRSWTSRLN